MSDMTLHNEFGSMAAPSGRRAQSARSVKRPTNDDEYGGMIDHISDILSNEDSDLSVDFADLVKSQKKAEIRQEAHDNHSAKPELTTPRAPKYSNHLIMDV